MEINRNGATKTVGNGKYIIHWNGCFLDIYKIKKKYPEKLEFDLIKTQIITNMTLEIFMNIQEKDINDMLR